MAITYSHCQERQMEIHTNGKTECVYVPPASCQQARARSRSADLISPKRMGPSKVAVVQQSSCLGSMVVASDDSETEFGWQDWLSQMRRLYLHHTEAHRITAEELKERLGLTTIEYYLWSYLFMVLWSRVLRYAGHVVRMQPDKLPKLLQMLGGVLLKQF